MEDSMFRIAAVLLFTTAGSSAWAGCVNYSETALLGELPRVELCLAGKCEQTTAEFSCGNAVGAQFGYTNGLRVYFESGGIIRALKNFEPVDYANLTCREIDEGACFPVGR
jgi:hypothetical protein